MLFSAISEGRGVGKRKCSKSVKSTFAGSLCAGIKSSPFTNRFASSSRIIPPGAGILRVRTWSADQSINFASGAITRCSLFAFESQFQPVNARLRCPASLSEARERDTLPDGRDSKRLVGTRLELNCAASGRSSSTRPRFKAGSITKTAPRASITGSRGCSSHRRKIPGARVRLRLFVGTSCNSSATRLRQQQAATLTRAAHH